MKKFLYSFLLVACTFVVLGSTNIFQMLHLNRDGLDPIQKVSTNYSPKYKDCIGANDFPLDFESKFVVLSPVQDWDVIKVNASIQKFHNSLDSTLKNLSSIDAHNYIHKEFERSKILLQRNDLTEIRRYYHCEIMRICYDSDRELNIGSMGQL